MGAGRRARRPADGALAEIEDVFGSDALAEHVSAGGVKNSLWFAGRATRIENEQRMFAIDGFRFALRAHIVSFAMPPDITAFANANIEVCSPKNDDALNVFVTFDCLVDVLLEGDMAMAASGMCGR